MNINDIDALIFDFDGVLTNNKVYIREDGLETVECSRSDGLAFDVLKKLNKPAIILSTEKSLVVQSRAKKLKIGAINGVNNKVEALNKLIIEHKYNLDKILYVGNDLNDYLAMKLCGYTACPADSHPQIKKISKVCLSKTGGNGVVRELVEEILNINFIQVLYN